MTKKDNWQDFVDVLKRNGITKLYHFTDRANLKSIIDHGGLYSWADCRDKNINIPYPGGGDLSRSLDSRRGLEHYVRVSFVKEHPMMYVAMNEGRILNPVVLEIDIDVVGWEESKFVDRNMTRNEAQASGSLRTLESLHYNVFRQRYFDLDDEDHTYYKAEVLVKNFIPLQYITNIGNFGYSIPTATQRQPSTPRYIEPDDQMMAAINRITKPMVSKTPYTAQITRNTPTAFIFLIDESVSMKATTNLYGQTMTLSQAVAQIVNSQINELVLRCIKTNEVRHYYDIAVVGYGHEVHSAWRGELEGRDFVSPEELKNHPFKKIKVIEQKRTHRGLKEKEVEKVQWIEPRHDGHWTHLHKAFAYAKNLLEKWMEVHHEQDCYPPTIINITDGVFNGTTKEELQRCANELKSMYTNDGNVLLFNIHVNCNSGFSLTFPIDKSEVANDPYATALYELSSMLPTRYNEPIAAVRHDADTKARHAAMAVNSDMATLIQLMDIGTPTNISQNQ